MAQPLQHLRKFIFLISAMGWMLLLAGCGQVEHSISGNTMGTTYHIKVVAPRSEKMVPVQKAVDTLLEAINDSMSTYRPESEISRFNRFDQTDTPFPISAHFLRVMLTAREIHALTAGAWDGTINPLVALWGFSRNTVPEQLPSDDAVHQALAKVSFDRIEVGVNGTLSKKQPDVTLDLASIAKGYAVDQVALLLRGRKYRQFLVEIGGEIYAAGARPDGKPWKVGINQPDKGAAVNAVYEVVPLTEMAMATSGDYRNFYEIDGQTYSHIIDPRTGRPVQNGVVSASVVADNCTLADGLATALMVMGPREGIALLDRLPGVEGLIVVRNADGRLENFGSNGF